MMMQELPQNASHVFDAEPPPPPPVAPAPLVAPVPSPSPSPPQPVIANIEPNTIDNRIRRFFILNAFLAAHRAALGPEGYHLGTSSYSTYRCFGANGDGINVDSRRGGQRALRLDDPKAPAHTPPRFRRRNS